MARENALLTMGNISSCDGLEKGMFEYESLMSCLVKVRIMDNNNHKQNSSNDTTMLKVYIAGELYPIHLYDSAPKCCHSNIPSNPTKYTKLTKSYQSRSYSRLLFTFRSQRRKGRSTRRLGKMLWGGCCSLLTAHLKRRKACLSMRASCLVY